MRGGGVHAGIVELEVLGHARQLLVELGQRGRDVEVGRRAGAAVGRDGEEAEAEPADRREVAPAAGRDPSSGNDAGRVGTPELVELAPGKQRQRHRRDQLVTDEDRLAVGVVSGHHSSCIHGRSR